MLGFNWVDAVIIVLLVLAVIEGIRVGVLAQLFIITGFFGTLFIAGWLFPHLLPIHDRTIRSIVNASLVLLAAMAAAAYSFDYGQNLHWSFRLGRHRHHPVLETTENAFGGLPGLAAGLVLIWLVGVMIGRLPFAGLSNSVSDSRIIQQLTRSLPPVPAVFASFDRQVDPNAEPYVFANPKPQPGFNYDGAALQAAGNKAVASMVRITSFSCGGVVSGSGFAVGQSLVATNAHVIAGSKRPIVKYDNKSYEAVPIYFDSTLDLAILRVNNLPAHALKLAASNAALGSTVAVLGYPGGNYRAVPGILRDTRAVSARSIYDEGAAGRGIYMVQADVTYGNSGGPAVLPSGQVAGILFSKSTDVSDIAFALTSVEMAPAVQQAAHSHARVSTGACMVD